MKSFLNILLSELASNWGRKDYNDQVCMYDICRYKDKLISYFKTMQRLIKSSKQTILFKESEYITKQLKKPVQLQSVRCVLKANKLKCRTKKLKRFLQVKVGWLNSKHKLMVMHYEHVSSSKCISLRAITAHKPQSMIFMKITTLMF